MKFKVVYFPLLLALFSLMCYITNFETTNTFAQLDNDWKTFISPKYKFSIDYPPELFAENELNVTFSDLPEVLFIGNDQIKGLNDAYLNIFPNNTVFINDMVKFFNSPLTRHAIQIYEKPVDITINNNTGVSFSYLELDFIYKEFFFTHGNKIYEFKVIGSTDEYNNSQFNRMVKSIKFFD